MNFNEVVSRIVSEAIIPGVGSVLSFIPTIALVICILTLLRESGLIRGALAYYLLGFSCSTAAILSCKTGCGTSCQSNFDKRQQILTCLLIPYISCSAKLPVYLLLCSAFFPIYPVAVIASLYMIGIFIILIANILVGFSPVYSMFQRAGLPQIRRPSLRIVFDAVKEVCFSFVKKAFTIIFICSMVVWFLQNLDRSFSFTSDINDSLLAQIGDFMSPLFRPLGLGDRRAVTALLSGLPAKEAAAGTLAVLAGAPAGAALCMMLKDIFTPASAFSFMVFYMLYAPCAATLGAIKTVTGKWRYAFISWLSQTVVAWIISFLTFNVARLFL